VQSDGEFSSKYSVKATRSSPPPTRFIPWVNTLNESPPSARKVLVTIR
jgi:hypothetical protein